VTTNREKLFEHFRNGTLGTVYGPPIPDLDVSGSSPTNRGGRSGKTRRLKIEMALIRRALWEIVAEQKPMTVRQVFYQAVSRGVVDKTEAQYWRRFLSRESSSWGLAGTRASL